MLGLEPKTSRQKCHIKPLCHVESGNQNLQKQRSYLLEVTTLAWTALLTFEKCPFKFV